MIETTRFIQAPQRLRQFARRSAAAGVVVWVLLVLTVTTDSHETELIHRVVFFAVLVIVPLALSLVPGTVVTNNTTTDGVDVSVNGQTPTSNLFAVDGVNMNVGIGPGGQSPGASVAGTSPATTASGGTSGIAPLAAVSEVTIATNTVEPQYGRLPGAQINLVTKSGTNEFHGSLGQFFGNNLFAANDWFANSRNLGQAPRRLNNFSGTFGGPIRKDKTFFFASYDGLRLRQPTTTITDVPSLNTRQAAPGAVQTFLNAFPAPNGNPTSSGFAEFAASYANPARHDVATIRVDEAINSRSILALRYTFADSDSSIRGGDGFSLNTINQIRKRAQTFTASLNQTLSPNMVLNLTGNYSRTRANGSYLVDEFGGAGVPPSFFNLSNSSFAVDLNARGANIFAGSDTANVQRQLNLLGGLTLVHGSHDLKFGVDYRRLAPIISSRAVEDSLLFNGVTPASNGVPTRVNHLTHLSPQTPLFDNLSLYAQDEWQWTPRLALTYGLRWELNPAPHSDVLGARLWQTTYANFAPRFSFAYKIAKTDGAALILRGGVGVHYDVGQEFAGDAFVDSVPFLGGASTTDSSVLPASGSLPFINFDPHLKLPYVLGWNVSLQGELGPKQTVSVAYVANTGRRLLSSQTVFDAEPRFGFTRFISNRAESNYRSLQVQFDRRLANGLKSVVAYTWAGLKDDVNLDTARRVLFAGANAEADRGSSDFDVRHSLNGFVSYELPALFARGLGNKVLRNWAVDSIFALRSARPVNVLLGFPTTYGFAYVRPRGVAGEPLYLFDAALPGGRRINPAAFVLPLTLTQGDLARNSLRGFPFYQFDLALRRSFAFSESTHLQFQADAFNVFNHPNFEDPAGDDLHLGPTFGQWIPYDQIPTTMRAAMSTIGNTAPRRLTAIT